MTHYLNESQEKAISVFMDKYGTDAGVEVITMFEKTGSLGKAMITYVLTKKDEEKKP